MNCFSDFMPCAEVTIDFVPTNICAQVAPESIASVSEKMVSVAIGSLQRWTLHAGNGKQNHQGVRSMGL